MGSWGPLGICFDEGGDLLPAIGKHTACYLPLQYRWLAVGLLVAMC